MIDHMNPIKAVAKPKPPMTTDKSILEAIKKIKYQGKSKKIAEELISSL